LNFSLSSSDAIIVQYGSEGFRSLPKEKENRTHKAAATISNLYSRIQTSISNPCLFVASYLCGTHSQLLKDFENVKETQLNMTFCSTGLTMHGQENHCI